MPKISFLVRHINRAQKTYIIYFKTTRFILATIMTTLRTQNVLEAYFCTQKTKIVTFLTSLLTKKVKTNSKEVKAWYGALEWRIGAIWRASICIWSQI